ncbi:MAG: DUF4190 domain-containing protein [Eubacterium sp.]|nr:DUF4190 domain-containing protein [Eubacterium sp.]
MFCKNCGTENFDEARFCKNCGQELVKEEQAATTAEPEKAATTPVYTGPVEYDSVAHSVTDDSEIPQSTGTAIASMVLGIVSIVFCCSSIIGLVTGIIAIVLAQKERNEGRADNGYVKAGLICGIIGAILSGLVLVYYIILLIAGSAASVMSYRF